MIHHLKPLFLAGAFAMAAGPALAGPASGAAGPADNFTSEEAAGFAKEIERDLAARGARLAIVFRAGSAREDLPDGISYTHGAFWVYQDIGLEDGSVMKGYAVYNLYHGDGETLPKRSSYLATDFPFDFVSGSTADDVAVIVPTPEMQRRIIQRIADGRYNTFHVPDYSIISNPADPQFQNCTEFVLDVISSAAWETEDYMQIKANLAAHFKPTQISVSPLKRLFGPAVDDRVRLSDQSGTIETVSYESLTDFMLNFELADETYKMVFDEKGMAG